MTIVVPVMGVMMIVVMVIMATEVVIVDHVLMPIMMVAFPGVKTRFMLRVKRDPHMVGAEIKVGTTYHSHIFSAVPHIRIGNRFNHHGRWRRGRYDYGCRRDNYGSWHPDLHIYPNPGTCRQ